MGDRLILETSFIIDLERERHRRSPGPAHRFLQGNAERGLCITVTSAGELSAGVSADERPAWEELIGRFDVLGIDLDVCWAYGRAFKYLKDNGISIGANDLWIAATAVAHELPLVTRNARHFARVPGLDVVGYDV